MDAQVDHPAEEIKRLQRCINDLVSLLALPAIWRGGEAAQIVHTLLDVLLRMLRLDFAYVRLNEAFGAVPVEVLRVAEHSKIGRLPGELGKIISDSFAGYAQGSLPHPRDGVAIEGIPTFPAPLGMHGEIGIIVVSSDRLGFPGQTESLLLSVAANQASIGLQEVRLLTEQKRIATELEHRVAERTTALAQTNEELRRSEERWRSVFENSAVGVALTDLDGRFVATNPVYQNMLGYTKEELCQLRFLDITVEEDRDSNAVFLGELLAETRRQFQIEKQYRRKDGQVVWVRNNVSVVPGTDRMPRFLMALSEDITQRKLSQEALAKARSDLAKVTRITSLGVLTASIAHEVNQPLSGIVTNASTCLRMLSVDPPNVDGARETARRTIRDGNRASDVITRLRTLYSKKEPSPEAMDLNEATREVTALSLGELQRAAVILRCELADDLPPIIGDRIQLQQVVLNLLRNAMDAMNTVDDRPRELLIRTEWESRDRVRLSVKDTGVGFAPQTADKIFEAFYTTKTDGMGIGLSVSHSIIDAHQGRLWAAPNDGPGCTFSFAIPCRPEGWTAAETPVNRADRSADAA